MAGGLAAAGVADRKRTGKQIFWKLELANECKLALAEPGGLRAFGLGRHLGVTILQELHQGQQISERENRRLLRWTIEGQLP